MVSTADTHRYGVVLDAGSSGTRVYVYKWLDNTVARLDASSRHALPELETKDKWTKKVHPGVSTFGTTPELVGDDHLKPLIKHALEYVPKEAVPTTPIFLLATAGMRLLPDFQRDALLRNICSYVQSETKFLMPDCGLHVQVISGETEGLYGWIAANYLLGGFDDKDRHNHGKGHHTYGFLDMGGASAQIAFAPNATEAEKHADDLTLLRLRTNNGVSQEYKVFVTTWLGFGANEARRRYVKDLVDSYSAERLTELPDPCLPQGLKLTLDGSIINLGENPPPGHHLVGTGKFDECLHRTFPLLEKDVPCPDEPCLVHGVHVPAIDFDVNHFVGISEYWHTTHEIFEMAHKDKSYDFNTYQSRVKEFCGQDWSVIEKGIVDKTWGKKVDEHTAFEVCFKASWLINMLHDGIGIPRVGIEDTAASSYNGTKEILQSGKDKGFLDPFQAVNKIKSTEVSWTMGKMVLYASASIPAAVEGDLPVGFGSNVPGISKDFQLPGGGLLQDIPDYTPGKTSNTGESSNSITNQIHDTLFKSDAPHRLPGFIFFLLILVIATFYLCGRDRRAKIRGALFGSFPSPGKSTSRGPLSFLNKILGRQRPAGRFDRELEDGTSRLYDPNDFELGNMSSSSDDDTFLEPADAFPKSKSRSKRNLGRMTPDLMDRAGLVVRTESRERLGGDMSLGIAPSKGRTSSRTASPSRGR
ncbi:apyrase [Exophiala aquamarina CBS 119918]|uniref:Apyrase n=1 Tax=Exophiala aquamarina CBS 119918 TaxID=1182545 RepID=A0A072P265_9EURO|nr:apyrase [Exophiala aquamarina CBS 119918]KEF53941.1 apyrase [Exophiala aquamarina CBS 119918]